MLVRDRIAPSPTGENLHIGNVYTALINFAFAKKHNGKFVVRIEDTDRTRLVEGSEQRILSSLKWFGIIYDEGPDVGGPFAPYRQSDRKDLYRTYAEELVEKGYAYYCFCDAKRLEEMRKAQQGKGAVTTYDGYCKITYTKEQAKEKAQHETHVIRLAVPDEGVTEFTDVIRGTISFENKLIDDQVILKSDGFPTYHLGVVVDDHLMEITHVIRAEEWIPSVPKHILLYKYFGWDLPVFCHVPILRNADRSKLSKRKNPVWVSWYQEEGFLPEAIINYLALMGWSHPEEKEVFPLEEFISVFDIKDLKAVGPVFDVEKLKWMNGEYIRSYSVDVIGKKLQDFYKNDKQIQEYILENKTILSEIVALAQTRMKTLKDFKELVIRETISYSPEERVVREALVASLESVTSWNKETILDAMKNTLKQTGAKGNVLYKLLTGKEKGLPLPETLTLFGKEPTLAILKNI